MTTFRGNKSWKKKTSNFIFCCFLVWSVSQLITVNCLIFHSDLLPRIIRSRIIFRATFFPVLLSLEPAGSPAAFEGNPQLCNGIPSLIPKTGTGIPVILLWFDGTKVNLDLASVDGGHLDVDISISYHNAKYVSDIHRRLRSYFTPVATHTWRPTKVGWHQFFDVCPISKDQHAKCKKIMFQPCFCRHAGNNHLELRLCTPYFFPCLVLKIFCSCSNTWLFNKKRRILIIPGTKSKRTVLFEASNIVLYENFLFVVLKVGCPQDSTFTEVESLIASRGMFLCKTFALNSGDYKISISPLPLSVFGVSRAKKKTYIGIWSGGGKHQHNSLELLKSACILSRQALSG